MNGKDSQYDDIIHLPHFVSSRHPQMPMSDRAAQFAPFAALTGHEAAVQETARLTTKKTELSDEEKYMLEKKLQLLSSRLAEMPAVAITYFRPDEKKSGGEYVSVSCRLKDIDTLNARIIASDTCIIPIDCITCIESELFREMF